jgi:hypothetical protein
MRAWRMARHDLLVEAVLVLYFRPIPLLFAADAGGRGGILRFFSPAADRVARVRSMKAGCP